MPEKTVYLRPVGIWYVPSTGHIHVAERDGFISTVSNDPESKRYHPNLFAKLAKRLREEGAPAPNLESINDE